MQNLIFDRFEILLNQEIEIAVNAGIFEVGVETLRADHLNLLEQSEVSSHNGNSTRYLKIERVNNVNLKTAEQAISQAAMCSGHLMINQKSGKAAIVLPTSSIVGDDGGVVSRVKLIHPNNDELRFTVENLDSSTWKEVSEQEFKSTWTRELNDVPRTSSQTIHLITGILLPIWKVLPQKHSKVFRLQLSTGEKVLGRVILPEDMAKVSQELGIKNTLLSSQEIISLVLNKFYSETLPGGVTLRRSLVAGESRLELVNAQSFAERLIQIGCFTEIIQWRKRIFIPTGVKAPSVLDAVINILG